MKYIVNFFRIIITILLLSILMYFVIEKVNSANGKVHTDFYGYSYFVVDNDSLKPDINSKSFVILKDNDNYEASVGDYILYYDGYNKRLLKIFKDYDSKYVIGDNTSNNYIEIEKSQALAVLIYNNTTVTILYYLFTNWIIILVLSLFVIFSPNITYKRFDL